MALTPEQVKKIRERDGIQPAPDQGAQARIAEFEAAIAPPAPEGTKLSLSPAGAMDMTKPIVQGAKNIASSFMDRGRTVIREATRGAEQGFDLNKSPIERTKVLLETGLRTAGEVGGGVADVIFEGIKAVTPDAIEKKIGEGIEKSEIVKSVGSKIAEFSNKYPEAMKDLEAALNVADLPVIAKAGKVVKAGTEITEKGLRNAGETIVEMSRPTEKAIDDYITKNFDKAIKPTIVGKNTANATEQYQNKALQAVKTITDNKSNLKFITDEGEEVTGRLPENIKEFAESIDQTKKGIYRQYNELAKSAGETGAVVDLSPIASELDQVINNKALQLSHPEAINYAQNLKTRFGKAGPIDTETAEALVQNYNSSLEAFYRNPTYDNASKAAIDAAIVNNIRKSLDDAIETATGKQYQALKNQYGSLRSIERDVVKRANVEARKQAKGLIDYTDIFSGGQIVSGILTMNPGLFAQGVAQRGIKEWFKFLNDPNRAVKKLFEKAEETPRQLQINTQGGYIKNPFKDDTPHTLTPDSVAKKMDPKDITIISDFLNKSDIESFMRAQPVIEVMGLSKLDPKVAEQFLREVVAQKSAKPSKATFTKGDKGKFTGSKSNKKKS